MLERYQDIGDSFIRLLQPATLIPGATADASFAHPASTHTWVYMSVQKFNMGTVFLDSKAQIQMQICTDNYILQTIG
jgi:hypothetical protein